MIIDVRIPEPVGPPILLYSQRRERSPITDEEIRELFEELDQGLRQTYRQLIRERKTYAAISYEVAIVRFSNENDEVETLLGTRCMGVSFLLAAPKPHQLIKQFGKRWRETLRTAQEEVREGDTIMTSVYLLGSRDTISKIVQAYDPRSRT